MIADAEPVLGMKWTDTHKNDYDLSTSFKTLESYTQPAASGYAHYFHHLAGFYCDIQPDPAEAFKWAKKDLENWLTLEW
ncbi:MAG: hypothetical protein WCT04_10795 [Planctomycetota bacterium]